MFSVTLMPIHIKNFCIEVGRYPWTLKILKRGCGSEPKGHGSAPTALHVMHTLSNESPSIPCDMIQTNGATYPVRLKPRKFHDYLKDPWVSMPYFLYGRLILRVDLCIENKHHTRLVLIAVARSVLLFQRFRVSSVFTFTYLRCIV